MTNAERRTPNAEGELGERDLASALRCSCRTLSGSLRALSGSLLLALAALTMAGIAFAQSPLPDPSTAAPAAIATALLDEKQDQKAREALAREASPRATPVVRASLAGMPDRDEAEEYRRIPWIWRVAVAAGRARDEAALKPLMDASMPTGDERLRDWQAVVLGGGVVMGLSQAGA